MLLVPSAIRRPARVVLVVLTIVIAALALSVALDPLRGMIRPRDALASLPNGAPARTAAERQVGALTTRLGQHPNDGASNRDLGLAYLQLARETGDPSYYPRAEAALNHAKQLTPDDPQVYVGLGTLALARHQFADALVWGERARTLNPAKSESYGVIGDAQVELGRYDEALDTTQHMVDLRPDLTSYARASYLRELQGDLPGAVQVMRLAASAASTAGEQGAWTRVQLGDLLLKSGAVDDAEREYHWALVADPSNMLAVAGLGHARLTVGDARGAIPYYDKAVKNLPLPSLVATLGDLYEATGRTDDARQQFALVRAIDTLWQANGGNVDLDLALFEADRGDPTKAVALARSEVARRPSISAEDALAWALYQGGDFAAAHGASRQALRLGTKDSLILFHAGMIDARLGNRAAARDELSLALRVDPGFSARYAPIARQTLAQMEASQ